MADDSTTTLDPQRWLEDHGDIMYRYALGRVRDPALAEDMVQEAFLAGMKSRTSFSGRSAERTWLIGILKHKIVDYIRKASRQTAYEDMELPAHGPDAVDEAYFDKKGRWKVKPPDWQMHPRESYEQEEFHDILHSCLGKLQERHRQVFILRELEGQSAEEICDELDISASNLWVILHRARNGLKGCLEKNWLQRDPEAS